ncbi:MAG: protein kinase [Planctomycetaceae bacterium]|nr:protein kinase [Planctomycetaceae bacterium]|tara:strand:+ start:326 stop:1240 length:915 start_codon:yes stop_codon:yes gene_type:complete
MGLFDNVKSLVGGKPKSDGNQKTVYRKNVNIEKRFEFVRTAVSGTMSKFFMARDRETDRIVGLKIADSDKTALFEQRFKTLKKPPEGLIASKVEHPNVVRTYEYGVSTLKQNYLVMEYLKGSGLHAMIYDRDSILEGNRLSLIRQFAEALGAVHDAGFIHRDICPRNFIITPDCTALKLFDFGLSLPDEPSFHQPGNRTGTPLYMAPEIVRRRKTDHRVDIFAMGVSFYQLLTFELPWPSNDASGLAALTHDTLEPTPILQYKPKLHPKLAEAIMICMSVNPNDRPKSADKFLQMISGVESIND